MVRRSQALVRLLRPTSESEEGALHFRRAPSSLTRRRLLAIGRGYQTKLMTHPGQNFCGITLVGPPSEHPWRVLRGQPFVHGALDVHGRQRVPQLTLRANRTGAHVGSILRVKSGGAGRARKDAREQARESGMDVASSDAYGSEEVDSS